MPRVTKIAIINTNFSGVESLVDNIATVWKSLASSNLQSKCRTEVISTEDVNGYLHDNFFYKNPSHKLLDDREIHNFMSRVNPDYINDYLEKSVSKVTDAEDADESVLCIVTGVTTNDTYNKLKTMGFRFYLLSVPEATRKENAMRLYPSLSSDELLEFMNGIEEINGDLAYDIEVDTKIESKGVQSIACAITMHLL